MNFFPLPGFNSSIIAGSNLCIVFFISPFFCGALKKANYEMKENVFGANCKNIKKLDRENERQKKNFFLSHSLTLNIFYIFLDLRIDSSTSIFLTFLLIAEKSGASSARYKKYYIKTLQVPYTTQLPSTQLLFLIPFC